MSKEDVSELIDLITDNLSGALPLYRDLDAQVFANNAIPPYFSGIGKHLRHLLDMFSSVVNGVSVDCIDFTDRKRGGAIEHQQTVAYQYYRRVMESLNQLRTYDPTHKVRVVDDLGRGKTQIQSNLASVLAQAHSHAIHHYASIGYLLYIQNVDIPLVTFGYNPSTPIY
ncbi:MAG: hypothetical protein PUP46_06780 [Endozoicomonas sp. (ex Botrylloides leachii)]|nr:hypothetical protein [Endozoicomonas sp. (ex Botrylloides leachii)]